MATDRLNNFNFTFMYRTAPTSGPSSSDAWNDSFNELANDLANIAQEWNNKIVKIIQTLPCGLQDTAVNAFKTGLEGKTLWADQDVVSTDNDLTFFNSTKSRPNTIKEQFDDVYNEITVRLNDLTNNIIDQATGLTTVQKNRIGANVFDSGAISAFTSLDGKSELNRLNVIQIFNDMYGNHGENLGNDGVGQLTNTLFQMIDALLTLHNGNWDDDIALDHTGVITVTQADINFSHPGDDTYVGSPSNLIHDLDRMRNRIQVYIGAATWLTALPALYSGGADSLFDLLSTTKGTGTKAVANPWGYNYDNIDGLVTRLNAIGTFTGQDSQTDTSPDYSSIGYITNSDPLQTAIGKLDAQLVIQGDTDVAVLAHLSALKSFTGQDNDTDPTPEYSSTTIVSNSDPLETAIGKLDANQGALTSSDLAQNNQLAAIEIFIGQNNNTDSSPGYSSQVFITNGNSLETAIGLLDAELNTQGAQDISVVNQLEALETFVGQGNDTDSAPGYSSNNFVIDTSSLEAAIGILDFALGEQSGINTSQITQLSALEIFVGQDSDGDNAPNYTSTVYITNNESLETSIGKLDAAIVAVSGEILDFSPQLAALEIFVGQGNDTDNSPQYSSTAHINNGESLEAAIGKLDAAIVAASGESDARYLPIDGSTPMDHLNVDFDVLVSGEITSSGDITTSGLLTVGEEIEVVSYGSGVIMASPDGTRYRLSIANGGGVTTTAI